MKGRTLPSPAPLHLIASVWLSESAWLYLALRALVAASAFDTVFSPAAVLAPYGVAILTTLLLGLWPLHAASHPPTSGASRRARYLSHAITVAATLALIALHLSAGFTCLLGVAWWELYRAENPLDPSWIGVALRDARGAGGTVPPLAWLVALSIFLWWRGTSLAREESDFPGLLSRFVWGTLMLVGFLIVWGTLLPDSSLVTVLVGSYLLFGLSGVGSARLEMAQQERLGDVDAGWRWGGSFMALLLLSAGFCLALLLLPQLGELARLLREFLANVLLPFLVDVLRWIVNLLGLDQPQEALPADPQLPARPPAQREQWLDFPDWFREAGRRVFDLSWISIILYGIYNWVRHWRWERRQGGDRHATRERIPWRLRLSLRAILLWLLSPLLARWPRLSRRIEHLLARGRGDRSVRELYRRLLAWGASRGHGRKPSATPNEYLGILCAAWPPLEGDFRTLTESYLRVRYGGLAVGEDELEAAARGWQRIAGKNL